MAAPIHQTQSSKDEKYIAEFIGTFFLCAHRWLHRRFRGRPGHRDDVQIPESDRQIENFLLNTLFIRTN